MSKYIPKVGEAFEWRGVEDGHWHTVGACIGHSTKSVGYEGPNGWINNINKECDFRPIPTKADVEREQLIDIVRKHRMLPEGRVELIQQAGFTIPKKIKRSELKKIINHHHSNSAVGYTKTVDILICKLLGDLVEQDKGGDV
jgi:hypothetical protein